ncbi:hypothetical protein [Pseudomonas citronellolis]|uniref:hypothetical protein n=1 Tax=Pseudomonas citronellolis TaxID=53408 RepID=UPI000AAE02A2|nr:hypothetical protein [Pseudomonas humi]
MAWRQHRWFRRWVIVVAFWAVPVAIVAVREIREEMAYNKADLQLALTTWQLTDAQQAAGAAAKCHGDADEARAAGCPAEVLAANAPRQQAARDEYVVRRNTLASYLWHAFVGYWGRAGRVPVRLRRRDRADPPRAAAAADQAARQATDGAAGSARCALTPRPFPQPRPDAARDIGAALARRDIGTRFDAFSRPNEKPLHVAVI